MFVAMILRWLLSSRYKIGLKYAILCLVINIKRSIQFTVLWFLIIMIFVPSSLVSEFKATVTVSDATLFHEAWVDGIGRRKGYGLGMMVRVKR